MQDQISILIPAFNREKFIGAAIDSIKQQTWKHLKIIVYDDGSQDNTVQVAEKYPDLTLIQGRQNQGVSYARNVLLNHCKTRYAAWQDSDDISNIHRIAEQYTMIRQSGAPIVFCNWQYFSSVTQIGWTNPPIIKDHDTSRCFGGCMFDLEQVQGIKFAEDINWGGEDFVWIEHIEKKVGSAVLLPKRLYYVRKHPQRISVIKRRASHRNKKRFSDANYFREMQKLK